MRKRKKIARKKQREKGDGDRGFNISRMLLREIIKERGVKLQRGKSKEKNKEREKKKREGEPKRKKKEK